MDGFFLDNIDGFRAGDDAAPTAASVFFDDPVVLASEFFGFGLAVKLTDGFGGISESGVVLIYDDLRDDGGDFFSFAFASKSIIDGLGKPVTDLALAHGDGGF